MASEATLDKFADWVCDWPGAVNGYSLKDSLLGKNTPTLDALSSMNHTFPDGSTVIPAGPESIVGTSNSLTYGLKTVVLLMFDKGDNDEEGSAAALVVEETASGKIIIEKLGATVSNKRSRIERLRNDRIPERLVL